MNGTAWIFDPITQEKHSPDCLIWKRQTSDYCDCQDQEAEMIEDFQVAQPYVRPQTVAQSDPNRPYQSLASLIRAARTAGLLKPVQQYGGGRTPASVP